VGKPERGSGGPAPLSPGPGSALSRPGPALEARRDEVTDWLIHETGAPVAAAELEWNLAREALLTAAALPYQVTGSMVPSDLPGRQTRVCRVPAGVIAVISPASFPLRLASRTTAAALAAGNAVVLKPSSDTPVTGGLLLLPPHVLLARDNVASTREELAGPVITIVRARDERDALRIANETGYGRSSGVFTRDIERGARVALGLNAAMTHVNDAPGNGDATDDPGDRRAIGDLTAEHWVNVPLGAGS